MAQKLVDSGFPTEQASMVMVTYEHPSTIVEAAGSSARPSTFLRPIVKIENSDVESHSGQPMDSTSAAATASNFATLWDVRWETGEGEGDVGRSGVREIQSEWFLTFCPLFSSGRGCG